MAIIIDTNCLSRVFNRKNVEFSEFEPVFNWIINGNGFIVYGGSKYIEELKKAKRYLGLFRILNDMGKVYKCPETEMIDELTDYYEKKYANEDFDDPHLPAIVIVTKCRLICSTDYRSIPYVTSSKMYPKRFVVPKYYQSRKDEKLLIESNIDKRLKCHRAKLNKKEKELIDDYMLNNRI